MLEVDALTLSGLVSSARRGPSVTLAVVEPEMQPHVVAAARSVRNHARALLSRTLFDTVGLVWWALAIAGDAFDLCGHRSGRMLIRSAIHKLEANDLRHMVLIPQAQPIDINSPPSNDPIERWDKLTSVRRVGRVAEKSLADVSATRTRRVGMARGAEGLWQKRLHRALWTLTINNVLLLLAGFVAWLFVMSLRNMPSGLSALLDPFLNAIQTLIPGFSAPIWRVGNQHHFSNNLAVTAEFAWNATLALLAVVITGAVAVAVASPRETSTRLWAQDRAWQLFIVAVGYGASTAAVVLALAPLPVWPSLQFHERAEVLTALGFAILTACAATSTSALQSRLDTWQQQRRSLTASSRLRRANDRLGPPPGVVSLAWRAAMCFALFMLPLSLLIVLLGLEPDMTPADFQFLFLTLGALNFVPMALLTMLFVIKWANDWGLAGRVATAMLFALGIALILFEVLYLIVFLTGDPLVDVLTVCLLQSPILLLWLALIAARALAKQDTIWTGPATFALYISIRLARWNYQRSVGGN